jgi:hypothetical protein
MKFKQILTQQEIDKIHREEEQSYRGVERAVIQKLWHKANDYLKNFTVSAEAVDLVNEIFEEEN